MWNNFSPTRSVIKNFSTGGTLSKETTVVTHSLLMALHKSNQFIIVSLFGTYARMHCHTCILSGCSISLNGNDHSISQH